MVVSSLDYSVRSIKWWSVAIIWVLSLGLVFAAAHIGNVTPKHGAAGGRRNRPNLMHSPGNGGAQGKFHVY